MKTNLQFKTENGKLYSSIIPKDVRKDVGNCPYCELPVYVASGQLLKYKNNQPTHKKCRL